MFRAFDFGGWQRHGRGVRGLRVSLTWPSGCVKIRPMGRSCQGSEDGRDQPSLPGQFPNRQENDFFRQQSERTKRTLLSRGFGLGCPRPRGF